MTEEWLHRNEFWRNRRVIVTGGAGFLGSVVVRRLHELGAGEVVVPRSAVYDLTQLEAIGTCWMIPVGLGRLTW